MLKMDLVTIVVPAYNAEQYLVENIESILGQTYKNLEIIYVCDGCTDNTVNILKTYRKDKRLKVCIEKENHGASYARNIGLNIAHGDWIIFLDADDIFEAIMIEEMVRCAKENCADICCCYYEKFDKFPNKEAGITDYQKKWYCNSYPIIETEKELNHILQLVEPSVFTKLIHKSIYKKKEVFFQNIPNSNDVYFSYVAIIESKRIVYLDKVFSHYRSDKGRKTLSTERNKDKAYFLEAYAKIYEYIIFKPTREKLLRSFYNEVCSSVLFCLDEPIRKDIINTLRNKYLTEWRMCNILEIANKLSPLNKEVFQKIINEDKKIEKEKIIMSSRINFVRSISENGCSIWGVGLIGGALLKELSQTDTQIQHIFDSAKEKIGKDICGYVIENFNEVQDKNPIIVTTPKYFEEIRAVIGNRVENVYNLEKEIMSHPF